MILARHRWGQNVPLDKLLIDQGGAPITDAVGVARRTMTPKAKDRESEQSIVSLFLSVLL